MKGVPRKVIKACCYPVCQGVQNLWETSFLTDQLLWMIHRLGTNLKIVNGLLMLK